jgi:hypothetical protein
MEFTKLKLLEKKGGIVKDGQTKLCESDPKVTVGILHASLQ